MNKEDEIYVYYLIGQNLKRIRKERGYTQERLATESTYSVGFIMNIESRKCLQTFSIGTLWRFSKVLDCDIRDFFRPLDDSESEN